MIGGLAEETKLTKGGATTTPTRNRVLGAAPSRARVGISPKIQPMITI
jgi:hypothetical protein